MHIAPAIAITESSTAYETIAPMKLFRPTGAISRMAVHQDVLCERRAAGWLRPDGAFLQLLLDRPELALVPESCSAEVALHAALNAESYRPVAPAELQALQDPDVRDSYTHFLRFRDGVLAAGTLEAYYMSLFPGGSRLLVDPINIPPIFIDLLVEAMVHHLLDDESATCDVYSLRAADMLFRSQRVSTQNGQVLSGDQSTLDMLNETGGLGDMGRFLAEAKAPLQSIELQVLTDNNAHEFLDDLQEHHQPGRRHRFLLDLTHEVSNDLSHGLVLTMTRARSGLKALASVLQQWVQHFLGVAVSIQPLQKIDDEAWRWHVGLDAQASALLNDLYEGHEVEPARLQRLVSLFRLDFADPLDMRADVAGKPVYLGLMMNADGVVRLKPQNLLLNLPLREVV
jgi:hypothetical protein